MSEESTEKIKAKTAFIIVQDVNGGFYALNSLDKEIEVERPATMQDMKIACQEIRDAVFRADIVNSVKAIFEAKQQETVSSSIREALEERDIL